MKCESADQCHCESPEQREGARQRIVLESSDVKRGVTDNTTWDGLMVGKGVIA